MSESLEPVLREPLAAGDKAGARRHVPRLDPPGPTASGATGPVPPDLTRGVLDAARTLGFVRAGVIAPERFAEAGKRFESWLADGCQGDMAYLETGEDRAAPTALLGEARACVVVALPHPAEPPAARSPTIELRRSATGPAIRSTGAIAKYARAADYHHVLKAKLLDLGDACARLAGRPVVARAAVDTAPLLEREAARRGGIGFIGKNTMLIVPGLGSYVMLGVLLVDLPLEATAFESVESFEGCGRCTACLDACPTGAFAGPFSLDARRCISYLTIEYAGVVPRKLRAPIGGRVFGCDVCQDVCPFNRTAHKKPSAEELGWFQHLTAPDLVELLELTSSQYRRFVRGTALRRVSRARLARNAAIALGNVGEEDAVAPLARAAVQQPSPLVRGHAAWALGRLFERKVALSEPSRKVASEALESAAQDEDPWVRSEAQSARSAV